MTPSMKALWASWNETRNFTLLFIDELTDADLDKPLPRKKLNTVRLQAHELILFQRDVVAGLETKTLCYEEAYHYENWTKQQLVERMTVLDEQLESVLEDMDGTEVIDYYGEKQNVHQILSMFIAHENMHIGQIIAFCYAVGIKIPEYITENMALEG